MNYLHNIIHSFMKDHGIKPYELFYTHPFEDETGYFDENKDFQMTGNHTKDYEYRTLVHILSGAVNAKPIGRYMPKRGDKYYYFEEKNSQKPDELEIRQAEWNDTLEDLGRHATGNCFRSETDIKNTSIKSFYKEKMLNYIEETEINDKKAYYHAA